ncbi:MAG TPA: HmuY family protein [Polyangiaceae bacterium]|nr:HmuY family protein [Polyangiaceae bacterium]
MLMVLACLLVACSSSPLDSAAAGGAGGGSADAAAAGAGASAGSPAFVDSCSAARAQLLGAIATVSSASVKVLSDSAGVKTLYVDASAGGRDAAATHPWTFIALGTATKAAVNDVTSLESLGWDLAFKRAQVYVNGGEGGPGVGASAFLAKDFADVTRADVTDAQFASEKFFDDDCNPYVDLTGAASTSLSAWYNYDQATNILTPVSGTWLVRGATGTYFKLRFESYYATPSGGEGNASGAYLLQIAGL